MDIQAAVHEFHHAFDLPVRADIRRFDAIPNDERQLRFRLLREEFGEYTDAEVKSDPTEVADALADMVYVAFGTALAYGIDLNAVLAEVHRSNMSKLGEDGKPVMREDGKVMKGPGYSPPGIAGVLGVTRADDGLDFSQSARQVSPEAGEVLRRLSQDADTAE